MSDTVFDDRRRDTHARRAPLYTRRHESIHPDAILVHRIGSRRDDQRRVDVGYSTWSPLDTIFIMTTWCHADCTHDHLVMSDTYFGIVDPGAATRTAPLSETRHPDLDR